MAWISNYVPQYYVGCDYLCMHALYTCLLHMNPRHSEHKDASWLLVVAFMKFERKNNIVTQKRVNGLR